MALSNRNSRIRIELLLALVVAGLIALGVFAIANPRHMRAPFAVAPPDAQTDVNSSRQSNACPTTYDEQPP